MGHKTEKAHKKQKSKPEDEGHATRKSMKPSKPSKSSKPPRSPKLSKPVVEHVSKKPEGVKKISKSKKPVNIAGVFKKSKYEEKRHRKHKPRSPSPEPTLADQFRNEIERARASIDTSLKTDFDTAHASLMHKLSESRKSDVQFFEKISSTVKMLCVPISQELIEVEFVREGNKAVETVTMGEQMAKFKKSLTKDDAKLKDYWEQWEAVQDELIELGMEVLGPEEFGEQTPRGKEGNGFKKEMDLLEREHEVKIQEIYDEIDEIETTFLKKMKKSERDLDQNARNQQAKLLQALIQD